MRRWATTAASTPSTARSSFSNAAPGEMQGSVLDASKEYQSCTGYILKKWIHRQSAFNYDTKSWTYRKYAYPYIRLAELYLSYAEADFEYNGSLSDASLNYLNLVRRRSGCPISRIRGPWPGAFPPATNCARCCTGSVRSNC